MKIIGNTKFGANINISDTVKIKATNIILGNNVIIKDNVIIECIGTFEVGDNSIIGANNIITCNNFKSGDWLYTCNNVEVGRGGCFNETSNVVLGEHVSLFENVIINPNSEVYIGDNTGIGSETMIWTHGAWLNPLDGYPREFGPVHIGYNVWLPARSIVLPNVTIGNNVVIGINTLINKDIPAGSLAAGIPVKVLRENIYPKHLDISEKNNILDGIISNWEQHITFKGVTDIIISNNNLIVTLNYKDQSTIFDINTMCITGANNKVSEDFRDYLRRNGIKIYTDKFFKSI
jgi:acetyltransferase-like isoleucine patch superfamily enzyme